MGHTGYLTGAPDGEPSPSEAQLEAMRQRLQGCRSCERLVAWRERIASERRAAYRDQTYWGKPIPGFGDPDAAVLLFGLAPAAHGANRTGRMFTGDRSGDFLFMALWRCGFANTPSSTAREDGLRLKQAYITAAVRCAPPANKPTSAERDRCRRWTEIEVALLKRVAVIVCLGGFAWQEALRLRAAQLSEAGSEAGSACRDRDRSPASRRAAARFAHGAELPPARTGAQQPGAFARASLLASYHPSQQNTFTGRLTPEMLEAVLWRARSLAGLSALKPPGARNR